MKLKSDGLKLYAIMEEEHLVVLKGVRLPSQIVYSLVFITATGIIFRDFVLLL